MSEWYFAHPYTAQSKGVKLRKYLERMSGVVLVNPFEMEEGLDPVTHAYRIVDGDLKAIAKSKGIVAWFPRLVGYPHIGTSMEICFARHVIGIPVIIYANPDVAKHPWLNVYGKVFTQISPLIEELKKYAEPIPDNRVAR